MLVADTPGLILISEDTICYTKAKVIVVNLHFTSDNNNNRGINKSNWQDMSDMTLAKYSCWYTKRITID
jgi:hypothetical protein